MVWTSLVVSCIFILKITSLCRVASPVVTAKSWELSIFYDRSTRSSITTLFCSVPVLFQGVYCNHQCRVLKILFFPTYWIREEVYGEFCGGTLLPLVYFSLHLLVTGYTNVGLINYGIYYLLQPLLLPVDCSLWSILEVLEVRSWWLRACDGLHFSAVEICLIASYFSVTFRVRSDHSGIAVNHYLFTRSGSARDIHRKTPKDTSLSKRFCRPPHCPILLSIQPSVSIAVIHPSYPNGKLFKILILLYENSQLNSINYHKWSQH